jgi:hypothetical protein
MIETGAPENKSRMVGRSQVWIYNGGCGYGCEGHRGKVEWHHPISARLDVGIWLCEAHHSLLKGRRKKYTFEYDIDKSIAEMRYEVCLLAVDCVKAAGFTAADIDKY